MTLLSLRGDIAAGVARACSEAGIPPTTFNGSLRGSASIEWVPDLTPTQQATVDSIVKLAVGATLLSTDDRTAIDPFLATGRTLLAMNQSTFTGQTQAQINRQVFDNLSGLWRVIFRLLRDS